MYFCSIHRYKVCLHNHLQWDLSLILSPVEMVTVEPKVRGQMKQEGPITCVDFILKMVKSVGEF